MFLLEAGNWLAGLEAIDRKIFFIINNQWTNSSFDVLSIYLRESVFWVPFYLFMLVFITSNFGVKGWLWVLVIACTAALTDMLSSHVLKPLIQRPRPCWNAEIAHQVRMLAAYCGRNFSFTSSHAANHFGLAAFMIFTLSDTIGRWVRLLWVWAAIICYAQVYVGVHYPLDVTGGALLGIFIGYCMATVFNKKIGLIKQ